MTAYYNEINSAACDVLEELIRSKIIADGVVDRRSITEVQPSDLRGFDQCHFFAGAGIWSAAARIAGWPDDKPLWTASCPCQPFSVAGKGAGVDDPRHLWPHLFRLSRAIRPSILVGEQVAGKAGYGWFDGVRTDLEGEDYACRAVDIPACSVNAPHQRSRLYWVAMADADTAGLALGRSQRSHDGAQFPSAERSDCDVGDATASSERQSSQECGRPSTIRGSDFWGDSNWIECADGKARRTKPGLRLLVDGMAGRIDLWRLAGNSIVAPLAAEVLGALLDVES